MQLSTDLKLVKRSGRTTPVRFQIERRTAAAKTMTAVSVEPQPSILPPTVQTEIERIGLGWTHLMIIVLAGSVWFADFATLHLSYLTADIISRDFGLTFFQRGLLSSAVWAGIFFGNLCSGAVMHWGRRPAILASLIGTAIFGCLAAACSTYYPLMATRFMAGAFLGIGQTATLVLVTECSPVAWRAVITGLVMGTAGIGEVFVEYVLGRDNADLDKIDWRSDSMIVCLPMFAGAVLSWFFLYESPLYTALSGRTEEAMTILERMAHHNGSPVLIRGVQIPTNPIAADTSPLSMGMLLRNWRVIFGPNFLCTTGIMMYELLIYNVLLTGGSYAFPQILMEDEEVDSPTNLLMFSVLIQQLAGPLFYILIYAPRRKTVIGIYSIAAAASCAALGHSLIHRRSAIVMISVIFIKQMDTLGSWVLPQYVAEVYPSAVRANGTAICLATGRLASIFAPVIFEWCVQGANAGTFFYSVAMLEVLCLVFVFLLRVDTANMMLEDDIPPDASPRRK